jgi:hypothetical protein
MNLKKTFLFLVFSILVFSCSTNTKEKTIVEEYNGNWVEFWDNADINDKKNLDIIQTMNENNIPLYNYHYKKASAVSETKFLIALKTDKEKEWSYYFVWTSIHKIEGPFTNDSGILPPVVK